MRKRHHLLLDYDDLPLEEVKKDARRLTDNHPMLGPYIIEESKTEGHYHVSWPRAWLRKKDAFNIAEESKCDKDWLDLCRHYGGLSLFREDAGLNQPVVGLKQKKYKERIGTPPLGSTTLIITGDGLTLRRIQAIGESTHKGTAARPGDPTWIYQTKWLLTIPPRVEIHISCTDRAQAERRAKWLRERCGLDFQYRIAGNPEV